MDTTLLQDQLGELVAIPSVNSGFGGVGEDAIVKHVSKFLRQRGLDVEVQEVGPGLRNVIARIEPEGRGGEPAVLLESHMDTVAAADWAKGDPFIPRIEGGRLYGRGACDTKASLAVMLGVVDYFVARPGALRTPLVFAATADEEVGQSGAFKLMESAGALAGAITGEPTLCQIVHAHKGFFRCRLMVRGVAAHSAFPEKGDNAILRMGRVLTRIASYEEELKGRPAHPALGAPTLSVGTIHGGEAINVVPDRCSIEIDRRMLPEETEETVRAEIEALIEPEGGTVEEGVVRPGLNTDPGSAFAAGLETAVKRHCEGRCEFLAAPYMTNATAYAAAGVPALVFGPGDIARAHTDAEFVELAELDTAFAILKDFLSHE